MTPLASARRVLIAAVGAASILSTLVVLGGDVGRAVAPLLACVGATTTVAIKARSQAGRTRAVLVLIGVGAAVLAANNVLDLGFALATTMPAAPSPWTLVFPAVSYTFVVAAAVVAIAPGLRGDPGGALDIAMLSVGLATAIWLAAGHAVLASSGYGRAQSLLVFALMLGLVVALAVIIDTGVHRLVDPVGRTPLTYLAVALTSGLTGNLVGPALAQSARVDGTIVQELWWLIAYVAVWAGFAHPRAERVLMLGARAPSTLTRTRVTWLALAIGVVPVIGTVRHLTGSRVDIAVWGLAQIALVSMAAARVAQLALWHRRSELALHELAHRDDLTQLANRRAVYDHLEAAIARLDGGDSHGIAVYFVDLDDFKAVNDTHGHAVGDHVLVEVSRRLVEASPHGLVGRVGGDEFVVITEHAVASAPEAVEAITARVFAEPIAFPTGAVTIRASVGWAAAAPGDTVTLDGLLTVADHAMYSDKRGPATDAQPHGQTAT